MPKLLIVTTVAATLKAFLLPYAKHFRAKGWTVDAMANGAAECSACGEAFSQCHDMPFSRKPLHLHNILGINARIRGLAAEEKYDIIHVHTPVAAFVTRLALRKTRRGEDAEGVKRPKIVYTAHGFHFLQGGSYFKNAAFIALERLAGDWTDHTITINEEDYEAALDYKISDETRLSFMPGVGIDFEKYSPRSVSGAEIKKFRAGLGLEESDELFSMAAEFIPRKRHEDAIRALAGTGRANFHLAFAGTGPLEEPMKKLASNLGAADRVHFLGQRTDIPLLMLSSRATVLPSGQEGLSRSVMESICLGVPVLGADARGIRDAVNSSERGILFPIGNHAALAAAMLTLALDRPQGKPAPDPLWSIENILREHEALYKELL